jgi:quercetin 2,3-dioxygenase
VSYLLQGGMKHRDSGGSAGTLTPGWVQWMDAAGGVVHAEMPSDELMRHGGTMEGFQVRPSGGGART